MRKQCLVFVFSICTYSSVSAKDSVQSINLIQQEVVTLQKQNDRLKKDVRELTRQNRKASDRIFALQGNVTSLNLQVDSLNKQLSALSVTQKAENETLTVRLGETKQDVQANQQQLSSTTTWGVVSVVLLLAVICAIVLLFLRKFKTGATSIDEVRKAQEVLRDAQRKMQEESIKLDNQLIAVASRQMAAATQPVGNGAEPDHSLAKKVADEIVRIEVNLSRMDSSIRGHRNLARAVQKIKDNFKANGYEIVDMLNQPFNEGMKVVANFVSDESLPEGAQIITGIIKPQINYNGQMIQSAQITVSQNI